MTRTFSEMANRDQSKESLVYGAVSPLRHNDEDFSGYHFVWL